MSTPTKKNIPSSPSRPPATGSSTSSAEGDSLRQSLHQQGPEPLLQAQEVEPDQTVDPGHITMEEQNIKVESLLNNDKYNGPIIEFFQQFPGARFGIIVSITSCFERWETRSRRSAKAAATPLSPGEAVGAPGGVEVTLEAKAGGNIKDKLSGTYKDRGHHCLWLCGNELKGEF